MGGQAAAGRPHRLAVYWRDEPAAGGAAGCELLVPGGLLRLNETAAVVWRALDGARDEAELAQVLRAACPDAGAAEVREAVGDLLEALAAAGAVVRGWTPLDPWPAPRLPPPGPA